MSRESKIRGHALMAVLSGLAGALGALTDHPVASAASSDVGDTLDQTVRGFEYGARAVRKMLTADAAADPFVAQMPKIIQEAMDDYQVFGTALSTWWSTCLSRRIEEFERGDQAEQRQEVGR